MAAELDTVKQEFHSLNNWLNKITMLSGQARYELETRGFDLDKLEEEKKKYIGLLDNVEEYALKIGEILKRVRKSISVK